MSIGKKYDAGKPRTDLLPAKALLEVAKVLACGANKYGANNWKNVEPFEGRYTAAMLRHVFARMTGEVVDPETNLPHMAHAACCALFLLSGELDMKPEPMNTLLSEGQNDPGTSETVPFIPKAPSCPKDEIAAMKEYRIVHMRKGALLKEVWAHDAPSAYETADEFREASEIGDTVSIIKSGNLISNWGIQS